MWTGKDVPFRKRKCDPPRKHKKSPRGHHEQCPPATEHEIQALSVGYKHLVCLVCLSLFWRRMLQTLRPKFINPSPFPLNPCPKRNLKIWFSVELCLKKNNGLGWPIGIFSQFESFVYFNFWCVCEHGSNLRTPERGREREQIWVSRPVCPRASLARGGGRVITLSA